MRFAWIRHNRALRRAGIALACALLVGPGIPAQPQRTMPAVVATAAPPASAATAAIPAATVTSRAPASARTSAAPAATSRTGRRAAAPAAGTPAAAARTNAPAVATTGGAPAAAATAGAPAAATTAGIPAAAGTAVEFLPATAFGSPATAISTGAASAASAPEPATTFATRPESPAPTVTPTASTSAGAPASAASAAAPAAATSTGKAAVTTTAAPSLNQIEHRTFEYFWQTTNPANGLVPDHWPLGQFHFSSIAAVGFGLTVYPIGVERGWITRDQAVQRVLTTLKFLANAPQGDSETKDAGYHGFFYHFLDLKTGLRYGPWVEVSTVDTAWLMAGVLFDETYFDKDDAQEREIRKLAEKLYRNVDWTWAQPRPPLITMGWTPQGKFLPYEYTGLDEAMMLYILALGSPTHAIKPDAWTAWTSTYKDTWGSFMGGKPHVGFAPLFGHQYTQSWIDMHGIQDAFMRRHDLTYFRNSRRSVIGQRAYAINIGTGNPSTGYGPNVWGLTASDGPGDTTWEHANGTTTLFHGYFARGADVGDIIDDGTIAPTAAISSIVFAPKLVLAAIDTMYARYGKWLYSRYGFFDAFNPTFRLNVPLRSGEVVPGEGWFDNRYLGIDEGPIVLMIENYRSGFVWRVMSRNPHIRKGLERAGFTGGWLASKPAKGPLTLAAPAATTVVPALPASALPVAPVTILPPVPVVVPVAPASNAPATPATIAPAAPASVAPTPPTSVGPVAPATIAPAAPATVVPVAPATIAPAAPATVAPAAPTTATPLVPVRVVPVAPAIIAPAAPATVAPAMSVPIAPTPPASIAPAPPMTTGPAVPTIVPAAPATVAPVAPMTTAPVAPTRVAPATPASAAGPATPATGTSGARPARVSHARVGHLQRPAATAAARRTRHHPATRERAS